jgi:hypothetical protein
VVTTYIKKVSDEYDTNVKGLADRINALITDCIEKQFFTPWANLSAEIKAAEEAERQRLAKEEERQRQEAERQRQEAGRKRLAEEEEERQRQEAERQRQEAGRKRLAKEEEERQRQEAERLAKEDAERKRLAEEERQRQDAERKRLAKEDAERKRLAEEEERKRLAEEERQRQEAERLAKEEERKRLAKEEERKRLAEEEAKKIKKVLINKRNKILKYLQNLNVNLDWRTTHSIAEATIKNRLANTRRVTLGNDPWYNDTRALIVKYKKMNTAELESVHKLMISLAYLPVGKNVLQKSIYGNTNTNIADTNRLKKFKTISGQHNDLIKNKVEIRAFIDKFNKIIKKNLIVQYPVIEKYVAPVPLYNDLSILERYNPGTFHYNHVYDYDGRVINSPDGSRPNTVGSYATPAGIVGGGIVGGYNAYRGSNRYRGSNEKTSTMLNDMACSASYIAFLILTILVIAYFTACIAKRNRITQERIRGTYLSNCETLNTRDVELTRILY